MKSIEIDEHVFAELEGRASGFNDTPNSVLRRILNLSAQQQLPTQQPQTPAPAPAPAKLTLMDFVRSDAFQRHRQAVDRFLIVLGWLHSANPKRFTEVAMGFQRGSRAYFAKSEKEILEGGDGVTARAIPESPLWALTTLDNKSKRFVLEQILREFDYSSGEINVVLAELPDSGIRRSHGYNVTQLLE